MSYVCQYNSMPTSFPYPLKHLSNVILNINTKSDNILFQTFIMLSFDLSTTSIKHYIWISSQFNTNIVSMCINIYYSNVIL